MALNIVENSGKVNYGIKKYICDTSRDLPTTPEQVEPGSTAYVISEKKTYILTPAGKWVEQSGAGGGGGSTGGIHFIVVNTLPTIGDSEAIYLVPKAQAETNNAYDKYIWINSKWELFGSEIENCVTEDELAAALSSYVTKASLARVATTGSYTDLTDTPAVPSNIEDLANVEINSPKQNDSLVYDETTQTYKNAQLGASSLGDLKDVTLSSLGDEDIIVYDINSSNFVNKPKQIVLTEVLRAEQETLIFNSSFIKDNSDIEFKASSMGVSFAKHPIISNGSITLRFKPFMEDVLIKLKITDNSGLFYDIDNNYIPRKINELEDIRVLSGRLKSGRTTLVLSDPCITSGSSISIMEVDNVRPIGYSINDDMLTITYDPQAKDMVVNVIVVKGNEEEIIDYEIEDMEVTRVINTGIKLQTEENIDKDWEMIIDYTIDSEKIGQFAYPICIADDSDDSLDAVGNSELWFTWSPETGFGFKDNIYHVPSRRFYVRCISGTLTIYNEDFSEYREFSWDTHNIQPSLTLYLGGMNNGEWNKEHTLCQGVINEFKFRWL